MDEINLIETPTQSKTERVVQGMLLFFGERLAIILFTLSIPLIILFLHAPQAFSDEEKDVFMKQDANWHTKVSLQVPIQPANISHSFSTATITPSPTPAPTSQPIQSSGSTDDVWEKLAQCESKGNWSINTGNGYFGGLQFNLSAWNGVGGLGYPHEASRDEQIMRGKMLQERRGWGPWGGCSKKLGLI